MDKKQDWAYNLAVKVFILLTQIFFILNLHALAGQNVYVEEKLETSEVFEIE